ncbi:transporter family protein [Ghiorsea bivora]|uniref:transporter n=1 Tax=Ghiorsea bivora TaxID=1485545 RepID=UPI00068EB1B5|nr:transporter [Ghiorsea bivora]
MFVWIMVLSSLFTFVGVATAGPITFNSALPVSEGVGILRSQLKLIRKTGDVTSQKRDLTVTAVPLVLAYGLSSKLALFGVVANVNKLMDTTMGGERIRRKTKGLGDSKLFARYTVYQVDSPGDTFRIAPFIGIKIPSGRYDKQDAFGLIPRPLQSGSGSWDPFVGIAITRQTLDWEFDVATSYQANTKAYDFKFGDEARLDGSFQYRILPHSLENIGVPSFIYAVLESNLIWNGKNKLAGATNVDSGGTTWNLVPGLQYVTSRYVLETAVLIPVKQQLNGTTLETDLVWTTGFRWNF